MDFLKILNIEKTNPGASTGISWDTDTAGDLLEIISPVDGKPIASVRQAGIEAYDNVVKAAMAAFLHWRMVPAPKRGEIVRQIGHRLRTYKESLGTLVS